MLKLRLLTAAILIPLVILAIFYLPRPFFVLATIFIFSLAAWEWARLGGWTRWWQRIFYIALILAAMIGTNFLPQGNIFSIVLGAFLWILISVWILTARHAKTLPTFPPVTILLLGFLILIPCWQAILWLARIPGLFFYMLLLIWIGDSAAYFGGRTWGKNPLAATISPNKTQEGFYTAILVSALCSPLLCWFVFTPFELKLSWLLPALPLIVAVVAGDLFESALKRMQNLKDSGHLLPGHGGILDRIDSLTAAAPVFACAVIFMQQSGY